MIRLKNILLIITLIFSVSSFACHNSTINSVSSVLNPDGTRTFTINVSIDVGGFDGYSLGFALIFSNTTATAPSITNLASGNITKGGYNDLVPYYGASIGTGGASPYFSSRYGGRNDVLTYESNDATWGFGSSDYNNKTIILTLSGCVETIELDADIRTTSNSASPNAACLISYATGLTCCTPPNAPTITTTPPTCSANGSSTISNYSASNTYTFSPSGPAVGAAGAITGMTTGTSYTVIATASGCSSSASNSFSNAAQLTAPATPTTTSNAATCSANGSSTISNYSGSNTYNFTPNGPSAGAGGAITGMTIGTSYTVTATAGGCTSNASNSFSNSAQLSSTTPTFTQVAAICSGGTITLPTTSNNSITGNWAPAVDNTTTTTYTFTPTAGQCASTTTMTVTVGPPSTPTFTQHQPICSGGTITLPTTSNESFTGTWSPAVDNTTTTTYTFTPSAGQCANTTTMTVTVGPPSTPTFSQVAAICSGGTFTLPTTSNESFTGTWAPAIDNTTTTTYTFTPTAGLCANTTTMTVTVNAPTTPTFTQVAAICSGGTFTLPTTSNNSITGTWTPAIDNTTTTTYTFTPTAGQCASTTTMTVTVNAPTTPTFTQVAAICSGGTFTLPTTSNNSFTGTWAPAIDNTTTTTYTFTPTAGQCASTTTMTVTVGPPSTPTFTQHQPICSGGTITLPTTSNESFTGTWSPAVDNTSTTTYTFTPIAGQCANTTTMTVTVGPPSTPTFTQVAAICSGGTFTLPTTSNNWFTGTWAPAIDNTTTTTYTYTPTAGQCASTTTMTVTVNPPTTPTFTPISSICSGGTFTLSTTSNNAITGTWAPAINNTSTTTYTFTPTAGQCASTNTISVTVNPMDDPTFSMTATCDGGTATIAGTTGGIFTFTTPPSDAAVINSNTGKITGGTSGTQYSVTYTTQGNCPDVSSQTVTAKPLLTPVVTCGNNSKYSLTFNWTAPNGATDYDITYSINGGTPISGGNVTTNSYIVSNLSVDDQVDISIITNGTECYDIATGTCMTQSCTPSKASFTFDPLRITNSNPNINFINSSTNSTNYYWDFGDGNTSTLENPSNEYVLDGQTSFNISLIAYNLDGCNDTINKVIKVEEELIYYVPNAFTPDGDKFNNEFKPVFYSGYDPNNYSMYIFNRWGQLVFETHDIEKGWKGLYGEGGPIVPDGVYTWKIEFKRTITDDVEIAIGTVNLIK